MRRRLRAAYRDLTFAASMVLCAIPIAHADHCDKNHYILDEVPPCLPDATVVPIGPPGSITVDMTGQVYFSSPNIVFKVDGRGHLVRVAGNGSPGYAGDNGPAIDALLNFPRTYPERESRGGWMDYGDLLGPLAVDRAGNLYVGDAYNNRVRKVSVDGVISTVVGNGRRAYFDSAEVLANIGVRNPIDGLAATDVRITWPSGVAVADDGTLFVVGSDCVRIAPDGVAHSLTAGCNRLGSLDLRGSLYTSYGIAVDAAGDLLATDIYCRVRGVRADGTLFTLAGADRKVDPKHGFVVTCGYSGDGGPATDAAMSWMLGVAADRHGNVFIADAYNHCIRRVDANGIISTFAGVCGGPTGTGGYRDGGFAGDRGPAIEARLNRPYGVAVDAAGDVYIADTGNFRIRKVDVLGIIDTIAGNGSDVPGAPTCGIVDEGWRCR